MKKLFNPNALAEASVKEQATIKFFLEKNEALKAKFPVDPNSKFIIKFGAEEYRIPEETLMKHTDFPVAANWEILDNLGSYWGFDQTLIENYLGLLYGCEVEVKESNLVDFYIFASCFQIFKTKQEASEEIKARLTARTLEKTLKLWSFCEEFQDVLIFFVRAECMDTSKPNSMLSRLIKTYSGLAAPQDQVDTKFISEGLIESITQEMLAMSHVKTKSIVKVIRGFYKEEKEKEAMKKIKDLMSNRPPWRVIRDRTEFMTSFPDMHEKIIHQEESLAILKNLTRRNLDEIEKLKNIVSGLVTNQNIIGLDSLTSGGNFTLSNEKKLKEEESKEESCNEHEKRLEAFIESGKKASLKPVTLEDQDGRILWTVDWHPNSEYFVVGDQKGGLKVYSVTTYQLEVYLPSLHTDVILCVAWSSDGKLIASAGGDKSVKFFNFQTRRIERDLLEYHQNWILSLAWSPTNRYLFSGSDDMSIRVYDYLTNFAVHCSSSHHERVAVSALWTDDEKFLVSIGDEASLCIFNFETKEIEKKVEKFHAVRINALSWYGNDNKKIVTVACADEEDPCVRLSTFPNLEKLVEITGYIFDWIPMCISKRTRSKYIVHRGKFATLKVSNLETGKSELELADIHEDTLHGCMLSPNANYIITVSRDKTMKLYNCAV